jgi:lipopolysaccharide/colanic/teichoic acid biosynthesis glycosyltransferase
MSQEVTFLHKIKARSAETMKRIFDIFISVLGLLILSPVFAIIAVSIKRSSPGPVFYRGPRTGRRGKVFQILKFRTMYERLESYNGPRITAGDDERITPSGRWLRGSKLNELPQLWNVLKGDMSLVGPRPEDPDLVANWPEDARQEILSVRPGITSPASVFFRDEENILRAESVMEKYLKIIVPSKIRLDTIYVREHTLVSDLDILFLTAIVFLPNLHNQTIPEHLLIWGPLSRFTSRHLNWFLIDVPIAFLAVILAGFLWRITGPLDLGLESSLLLAILIALFFGVINTILGMNRIVWESARPSDAWGLVVSALIVTGTLWSSELFWPGGFDLPVGMLVLTGMFALSGFMVARFQTRLLTGLASRWLRLRGSATHLGERILIIGAGEMAQITIRLLRQNGYKQSYSVIGLIDDNPKVMGLKVDGCKVIGSSRDLPRLIKEKNIGTIMYAIGNIDPERRRQILENCSQTGIRLIMIPNILELLSACLFSPQTLQNNNLVSINRDGSIPVEVIMSWLTELESLTHPRNTHLLSRLRELRDALAANIMSEQ